MYLHPDALAEAGGGFENAFVGCRILKLRVDFCQWDYDKRQFPKFIMTGLIVKKDRVNVDRTGRIFIGGPFSAQFRFDWMDHLRFQFSEGQRSKK